MKKIFTLAAAFLMGMAAFATPSTTPTVAVLAAKYDCTNHHVICIYFDEKVCNDLVWAGGYNAWATTPATMIHGEELDATNYPGWYVFEDTTSVASTQGKPVQLMSDGSFDWSYQTGDAASWVNMSVEGTKTMTFDGGYDGEANCVWPEFGAYIYESQYFKKHNSPCVERVYHNYTVNLYTPAFCQAVAVYADTVVCVGDFDSWGAGLKMNALLDDNMNTYYQTTFKSYVGATFKFKLGFADWSHEIQYYNQDEDSWNALGNITLNDTTNHAVTYANDSVMTVDYSDAATYRFSDCADPSALEEVAAPVHSSKAIINGKLILIRDDKRYNAAGMQIK